MNSEFRNIDGKMKKIDYLYAADNNFAKVLGTSLYSLCMKNCDNIKKVHIISQEISDENKQKIQAISKKFNIKINFIEMPNFNKILGKQVDIKRYSASMFSRIMISSLLPNDIKKIIYLDCDTLIMKNLKELWNYDLNGKIIGAVNDYRSIYYQKNLKITSNNCYINSGVLLIDLEKYRKNEYEKKLIDIIEKYNGIFEFPDNDAICKVLQNDIQLLPLKYNVSSVFFMTTEKELKKLRRPHIVYDDATIIEAKKNPSIVHFTTCFLMKGRPWLKRCNHPLTQEYIKIYEQTPWKDEELSDEKSNLKKKIKYMIVKILPRKVLIFLSGIMHAYIKPYVQKRKYKKVE